MTSYRLGVNTCFAVKRWPQPARWAGLVRADLGLDLVQHSLDLVDVDAPAGLVAAQARDVRNACRDHGLTLNSTFTGLAAYSSNLLLHPEAAARTRARDWYRRVIGFTAEAGGAGTGGHVGAFAVDEWLDPVRRAERWAGLGEALTGLAADAHGAGLRVFLVENLAAAREPSTMAGIAALLRPGDAAHVPIALCLDVGHQCVPGTSGAERDPYAWLARLGAQAPVVQLQQFDGTADHHWPFTPETNAAGLIRADAVLEALDRSGAGEVALILEIVPPFEQDDAAVLADLRQSAGYWRAALAAHAGG